jgi:hypothetical protein
MNPEEDLHTVAFPGALDWVSNTSIIVPKEEELHQLIESDWKDGTVLEEESEEVSLDE